MSPEELDSGMISQENSAMDITPDKPAIEDSIEDEPGESLSERLWGLTEMFPEPLRNVTYGVTVTAKNTIQSLYSFSRSAIWIVASSTIILFAPVTFEVERFQMEEAHRSQQKQLLLGPNAGITGGNLQPVMPPLQR